MANKFGEFVGMSIVALLLIAATATILAYAYFVFTWAFGLR